MATKKKSIDDLEDESVHRMLTGQPPIKKKPVKAPVKKKPAPKK